MSLAVKATRGALWTVGAGLATRALSVFGTLVLTHLLAPEVVGEVAVATVVVLTANQVSLIGFGQYLIAHPDADRRAVFHATMYNLIFAAAGLGGVLWLGEHLAPAFGAPDMTRYLPGLVGAVALQRLTFIPARLLARDLRFRTAAIGQAAGELSYVGFSVGLAAAGFGGEAIVWGNVARAAASGVVYLLAVRPGDWLVPCRPSAAYTRDLFRFGAPISVAALAAFASRRWDNLLFSSMFGPAQMGLYNLAYNLADIPATHVGEQVADVLLPSFARLRGRQRVEGMARATSVFALVLFPLSIGLGAVAPTLVDAALGPDWQGVAPLLVVLSVLGGVRPIGNAVSVYLQARDRPRAVMFLQLAKVVGLLACVFVFGLLGPVWACVGVGIAFAGYALAGLAVIRRIDDLALGAVLGRVTGPLLACGMMVAAVLVVRLAGTGLPVGVRLALEIAAGAAVYVPSALRLAPESSRDLLHLARRALGRRRGPAGGAR